MLRHLLQELKCSGADLDINDKIALVDRDGQLYVKPFRLFERRMDQSLVEI
jgi:hypothetical protein